MERDKGQRAAGAPSARTLRLVGVTDAPGAPAGPSFVVDRTVSGPRRVAEARRDVARENVESAHERTLDPRDPRWLVALEASRLMEGPLLTFERRRRVLALAHRVGVRSFDTHLIIAAVQDRARRGEPLSEAIPVIATAATPSRTDRPWWERMFRAFWPYGIAALAAAAVHAALVYWLVGPR